MTGIVLAGGRASRFGRDKLLEPAGGGPLLWRPIRAVAAISHEVLLATARERVYPLPPGVAVRVVADARPDAGPVEGLRAALAAARYGAAIVVAGDMPSLDVRDLRLLLEAIDHGANAATFGQPLPCAASVARAREVVEGPASLRAVLGALGAVRLVPTNPDTLRDVDEPGDLPLA